MNYLRLSAFICGWLSCESMGIAIASSLGYNPPAYEIAPPLPRHPRLLSLRAARRFRSRRPNEEWRVPRQTAGGTDAGDELRQELHPNPGFLRGRCLPARRPRALPQIG